MKNITLLTTISLFLGMALSCTAQFNNKDIKGSNRVITEERQVAAFTKVHAARSITVYLSQSSQQSITVEADDNILPYLETKVENGSLTVTITQNVNIKSYETMTVRISAPEISELKASTSADVKGATPWEAGNLTMHASTSASIELDVKALEIDASASTSSDIDLQGSAVTLYAKASTSGSINAKKLTAEKVTAQASTSGDVKVFATQSIEAKASTSGSIYYKGDATLQNSKASTGGDITKKN